MPGTTTGWRAGPSVSELAGGARAGGLVGRLRAGFASWRSMGPRQGTAVAARMVAERVAGPVRAWRLRRRAGWTSGCNVRPAMVFWETHRDGHAQGRRRLYGDVVSPNLRPGPTTTLVRVPRHGAAQLRDRTCGPAAPSRTQPPTAGCPDRGGRPKLWSTSGRARSVSRPLSSGCGSNGSNRSASHHFLPPKFVAKLGATDAACS